MQGGDAPTLDEEPGMINRILGSRRCGAMLVVCTPVLFASAALSPPAPGTGSDIQRQAIIGLIAALAAVGLIMAGLIWLARRRTLNTVEAKIKEYRKRSV